MRWETSRLGLQQMFKPSVQGTDLWTQALDTGEGSSRKIVTYVGLMCASYLRRSNVKKANLCKLCLKVWRTVVEPQTFMNTWPSSTLWSTNLNQRKVEGFEGCVNEGLKGQNLHLLPYFRQVQLRQLSWNQMKFWAKILKQKLKMSSTQ